MSLLSPLSCVPPAENRRAQATQISPRLPGEFNELAPTFLMEVQTNQTVEKTHTHTLCRGEDRVGLCSLSPPSPYYYFHHYYHYYYNFLSFHLSRIFRPETLQEIRVRSFLFTHELKKYKTTSVLKAVRKPGFRYQELCRGDEINPESNFA